MCFKRAARVEAGTYIHLSLARVASTQRLKDGLLFLLLRP
jgi:hypothetical protein